MSDVKVKEFDGDCLIENALAGNLGADAERIARTGVQWIAEMIRKNIDYGSKIWTPPVLAKHLSGGEAIKVRMSDKIQRLENLLDGAKAALVKDESVDDTFRDLGAYCLLYLARPEK